MFVCFCILYFIEIGMGNEIISKNKNIVPNITHARTHLGDDSFHLLSVSAIDMLYIYMKQQFVDYNSFHFFCK